MKRARERERRGREAERKGGRRERERKRDERTERRTNEERSEILLHVLLPISHNATYIRRAYRLAACHEHLHPEGTQKVHLTTVIS